MRLLHCTSEDEFELTKDFVGDDEIPSYAILSHTWKDGDEVTFNELKSGLGKDKTGYEKIRFCAQQAQRDGLRFFWVDTCCINKSDPIELQDAINSMFRWYQAATRCYVYLSDVSTASTVRRTVSDGISESTWEPAFRASRWFTRGWTLQELLAPRLVMFFSLEGNYLGEKRNLEPQISEITGIAVAALQGYRDFDVEERFSWIKNRQTTRKEDKAYSLLGIFGVFMPLLYGEGEGNAFKRLREEIQKSSQALSQQRASFQLEKEDQKCMKDLRLTDPRDDKKRIEETKGGLLEDSYRWILDNADFRQWHDHQQSQLLWIKGDPGKGKTMLLCGIINELEKSQAEKDLFSYFFCQATDSRLNSATVVLRGLLYLLVDQKPSLISHIRKKHDHAGKALFEDANAWVALCKIFTNMLEDPSLNSAFLIVDALDECDSAELPKLLNFIAKKSAIYSRVKWIISSRNWPEIEERLEKAGHKVTLSLELNVQTISKAVGIFVHHKVLQLAEQKRYDDKTRNAVLDYLLSNANDTFLWVALVCQKLEAVSKRHVMAKMITFPPGLDLLYERMMKQISTSDDAPLCKQVLAIAATVYRPVTLPELTTLVEQLEDEADDPESINEIIGYCGSFLTLRCDTIYFVHQSAKEFVCTKASHEIFPFGRTHAHSVLLSRSLHIMSSAALHRDMYDLRKPGYPIEEVKKPDPDPLAAMRYSCIHWVDHLYDCNIKSMPDAQQFLQKGGAIDTFLSTKYLYWLEALCLCQSVSKGVSSMVQLASLVQERTDASALRELIYDAQRFVMYHKVPIENYPLQIYSSALLFSPSQSLIRQIFKEEAPTWVTIMPSMQDEWDACLQTLEGHNGNVHSVVFSHDSSKLASASAADVKIWDTVSGQCLQTFKAPDRFGSIAFSHDSKRLVAVSRDGTVHMWNVINGECILTLKWPATPDDHQTIGGSVNFSCNSAQLVSTYSSKLALWDVSNGKYLQILEGHTKEIREVSFSCDSTRLASASSDESIKIWDVYSGRCLKTLESNAGSHSVVFFQDSTRLISSSYSEIVIWNWNSGERLQVFGNGAGSLALSHDSLQLASAIGSAVYLGHEQWRVSPRSHRT